jgi:acid phosphatase family membrane protein YuiD
MSGLGDNRILLTALIAWATAQSLKVPSTLLAKRRWDFMRLVSPGGMPSHSSYPCADAFYPAYCHRKYLPGVSSGHTSVAREGHH